MVVVFDLDDTLYKEIDFVKSAYWEIASKIGLPLAYDFMLETYNKGGNAFQAVIERCNLKYTVADLLDIYRNHLPDISLDKSVATTLDTLKKNNILALLSDGRSTQQRNKIKALGLDRYIEPQNMLISAEFGHEKPDKEGYVYFMEKYHDEHFAYVGDNTTKDFVAPNSLGWTTVCLLDDGRNIHKQNFTTDEAYQPKFKIGNLYELVGIIK